MTQPNLPYTSLEALQDAHGVLLARFPKSAEPDPAAVAAARDFLQAGQALGVWLDSARQRRTAQSLLDYWSTQLYRATGIDEEATLAEFDPNLAPELPDEPQPYRGLAEFVEADHDVFFGRETLVAKCVRRLQAERALLVVGASGSGKSSLVRAGLIVALRGGALPGSEAWRYLPPIVPGSNPPATLDRALAHAPAGEAPRVLLVDQVEEIFTLADKPDREAFAGRLLEFARANYLILTLRSDFEPKLAALPGYQALVEQAEPVRPLTAAELRQAIERPAERVGLKYEEGVVTSLLEDVLGEPAALPLLQFTLQQLWEKRDHNRVTCAMYHDLGGGRQALQNAADRYFAEELLPEEREVARRIFLKLVRPGEGLEVTSQRLRRVELFSKAYNPELTERTLEKLVCEARLLKQTEGDSPEDVQVEVAHEALVRNWPTLVNWLEDEREHVRARNRLRDQVLRWQADPDPGLLWRGRDLEKAETYDDLSQAEDAFVRASRAALEAEARAQDAARQLKVEADANRRVAQLRVRFSAALTALAVVALVVVAYLGAQALKNASLATSAGAVAQAANTQVVGQRATADFAATQAVEQRATADAAVTQAVEQRATADAAVTQAVAQRATAEAASTLAVMQVLISQDRQAAANAAIATAAAAQAGQAQAAQAAQAALSRQLAAQAKNYLNTNLNLALLLSIQAYSVTQTIEATGVLSAAIQQASARTVAAVDVTLPSLQPEGIQSLAFSPAGDTLVWFGSRGSQRGWDLTAGQELPALARKVKQTPPPGTAIQAALVLRPAARVAFSYDNGEVYVADMPSGAVTQPLEAPSSNPLLSPAPTTSLALSPDGATLAAGRTDGRVILWDWVTGRQTAQLNPTFYSLIHSLAFSDDGHYLAAGSADGSLRIFDTRSGREALPLKGHLGSVNGLAWINGSGGLVSGGADGRVFIWQFDFSAVPPTAQTAAAFRLAAGAVTALAVSPDQRVLVAGHADGSLSYVDIEGRALPVLTVIKQHGASVGALAFEPDGRLLASGDDNGFVLLQRLIALLPPGQGGLVAQACQFPSGSAQADWEAFFAGQVYHPPYPCPAGP